MRDYSRCCLSSCPLCKVTGGKEGILPLEAAGCRGGHCCSVSIYQYKIQHLAGTQINQELIACQGYQLSLSEKHEWKQHSPVSTWVLLEVLNTHCLCMQGFSFAGRVFHLHRGGNLIYDCIITNNINGYVCYRHLFLTAGQQDGI